MRSIFYLLLIVGLSFGLMSESNSDWNKKGEIALKKKDYEKASTFFKKSIEKDPNDAYANYNLACTYSLQLSICELENDEESIMKLLKKAIQKKPSYRTKMMEDLDLEEIKNYQFYELAGLDKKKILTKVKWNGPTPGATGPIDQISFDEKGKFTYSMNSLSDDGTIKKIKYTGTYSFKSDVLWLEFTKSPLESKKKKLKVDYKKGNLQIEGFDHPLTDIKDRCSA